MTQKLLFFLMVIFHTPIITYFGCTAFFVSYAAVAWFHHKKKFSCCIHVCKLDLSRKFTVLWWGMFQTRCQTRIESNICVDLYMCGICLWFLSIGPLPGVAAHTVKSYECWWSPRGYRHFNNAWIIQSKSILVDLPGAAK